MSELEPQRAGWSGWWIVGIIAVTLIVGPFVGLYFWGLFLPDDYEVTVSGTLAMDAETLYATIADPEKQAEWRPGVTRGEVVETDPDGPVVIMHTGDTKMTLRREAATPYSVVVWTVVPSRKQVFEGAWTYALAPVEGGTRLSVTEQGNLASPFARAATQAFFGLDTYSKANLRSLARYHHVDVTVEP